MTMPHHSTTSAGKFDQLDALIVSRISRAPCTFTELQGKGLRDAADALVKVDRHGFKEGSRLIDRRLQALRKAARIVYSKGRWWIKGTEALL